MGRIFLVFLVMVGAGPVHADGMLKLGFLYLSTDTDSGGTKSESSRMLLDVNPAYIWPKGWAFGLLYGMDKSKNSGVASDRTSYGPSFGWITRKEYGPYVMASYLLKSELEQYEGDGIQADLGYKFPLRKIDLGFQLSYKMFNYKKLNGATLSTPYKENKIDPYFILMLQF